MPKRKVSPDPREAQRQELTAAAARAVAGEDKQALVLAWASLLMVWEASEALRRSSGEFFVVGEIVREFLATMRSLLKNGLPRSVAQNLEEPSAD